MFGYLLEQSAQVVVLNELLKQAFLSSEQIIVSIYHHFERSLFDLLSEWFDYAINLCGTQRNVLQLNKTLIKWFILSLLVPDLRGVEFLNLSVYLPYLNFFD